MTTPMFRQFNALKAQVPDAILFYRMGDFYETFYEDAVVAARVLELTLTARNKADPNPVPMAGVPHHAATGYVQRLVDAGHKVAIAEQVEDPAKAKGLVKREIVRVVTPGVVLDPSSLDARTANWLVAVLGRSGRGQAAGWGVAALEASTGTLRLTSVPDAAAAVAELERLEPREVLLGPVREDEALATLRATADRLQAVISEVDPEAWRSDVATAELHAVLGVATLEGFGVDAKVHGPGVRAAGAVVRYARERLGQQLRNVHTLSTWSRDGVVVLDGATRRNLELLRTSRGGKRRGSLLGLLDRTRTAMGGRALRELLVAPSTDLATIHGRLAAVGALVDTATARDGLREALAAVCDIERILARVAQGTAHARDLVALARALDAVPDVASAVHGVSVLTPHLPTDVCADVATELSHWLADDPPLALTDGGLLRRGAHEGLDELIELAVEGAGILRALEAREREATGIPTLKVRHNKVFGYYIEVTRAQAHKAPDSYLRKQTLTNAERFITPELKELEEKLLGADERRKRLEYALFVALRDRVQAQAGRLAALAASLAHLDVLSTLAAVAEDQRWCCPVVDSGTALRVRGGRHPVVEAMLPTDEAFVPNDVHLDATVDEASGPAARLVVLTGPNMSGKSTVMRQVALITLLAQMGSFVPADHAQVGVVDRIFTRVGASDDLSSGQSTFMVEMSETAAILHHATARSLVVLDEIGRGTSTYDGLALAWSVAEDLVARVGCRAIFATHYHELCELASTPLGQEGGVVNQHVAVRTTGGAITFLRTLAAGGASRSYGLECARLAGLPRAVVGRARTLLNHFEKHAPRNEREQLSLFGVGTTATVQPGEASTDPAGPVLAGELADLLATLDPDDLSPREAQAMLYRLHGAWRELA